MYLCPPPAPRDANGGAWPETVAVNLWGLDSIKTKGESVAIVLCMLGARPVKEGTGRISRFELIPLEGEEGRGRQPEPQQVTSRKCSSENRPSFEKAWAGREAPLPTADMCM